MQSDFGDSNNPRNQPCQQLCFPNLHQLEVCDSSPENSTEAAQQEDSVLRMHETELLNLSIQWIGISSIQGKRTQSTWKKTPTFLSEEHVYDMVVTDSQLNQRWQRFERVKHSSQTPQGLIYATGQHLHIMNFPPRGSHLLLLPRSGGNSHLPSRLCI